MLIKILYFVSLCLGAEPAKSVLKTPSVNYISHEGIDLSPKLDLKELDIGEVYHIGLFLEDLELHENYQSFMQKCHPFEEISKEQSWELRYYILTSWAAEQMLECTDHHGFFPILSTESVENVYIPLALLLKQGFRKHTLSCACLWDVCLTSLQQYLSIMVHDGNPYDPKHQKKQYHKIRYPYKKTALEIVAQLEEELSMRIGTDDTEPKVTFEDKTEILEIIPNRSINYFLRNLIEAGTIINQFCFDIVRANPDLLDGYANKKECIYDLHAKYGILYDFVFDSDYQLQICLMGLNMAGIRPQFDQVWETYKDHIEDWDQQQIKAMFYPEVFEKVSKAHPQPKSEPQQETPFGHKLVRTKSFSGNLASVLEDEEDLSITGFDAGLDFSNDGPSLEVPLLSKASHLSDPE